VWEMHLAIGARPKVCACEVEVVEVQLLMSDLVRIYFLVEIDLGNSLQEEKLVQLLMLEAEDFQVSC
jgi:hypothetical protein